MSGRLDRLARRHGTTRGRALFAEAMIRAWTVAPVRALLRPFLARREPGGWIFVVGCYNAGTTIVKRAVMAHPQVVGMPVEGDTLTSHLHQFEDGGYPRGMFANREAILAARAAAPPDPARLAADWAPWIREDRHFLEKSISNSMRMAQLRAAFPGCRFVAVVRDPEDVATGIRRRSRPANGGEYADDFLRGQWSFFYRTILEDADPEDTVFCSYEGFIQDPAGETTRLHAALGLPAVEVEHQEGRLSIAGQDLSIRPLPVERVAWSDGRRQAEETLARLAEATS